MSVNILGKSIWKFLLPTFASVTHCNEKANAKSSQSY